MRDAAVYAIKRAMPRMSWAPQNLYNLFQRTMNPASQKYRDTRFSRTGRTLFQQRWVSKALVRAYHGDYIPEKIFKRWYLPETLPDVRPKRRVFGDDTDSLKLFALRKRAQSAEKRTAKEEEEKGMAPVGSLMFSEVERRIDTFVFRCCFTHSIYEARRLVIHGDVMLNGKKHTNANTRLAPGDMVSVNPKAIRFLQPPHNPQDHAEGATASDDRPISGELPSASGDSKYPNLLFNLPPYAAPWIFIPAYIEPNFKTCSAVYVRHPTARPGYSEIPTPYDADGEIVRFAWEWYAKVRPRLRSKRQLARMPEDRALGMSSSFETRR